MFSAGFRQQNKMEEDRNDPGYSADYTNESRDRHEDRRRRDHDRDRDYDRSRGRDRDRRRSKSRSRSRSRSRERDGDRRKRRDRYDDDSRYNAEGSRNSGDRSKPVGKQRQDKDWRMRLTSIRDAHFNRSKQPPSIAQNQFTNDGSFLEKFKMMAEGNSNGSSVMPNSLVLASSSIKYSPEISLPPLTVTTLPEPSKPSTSATEDQDLDGVPIKKPIPVPVSVGRRRHVKPLKTGVVFKKTQQSEEDEASQEKLDAWSRYLQEVQKYKNDNCVEEDSSRPLVK